MRKIFHNYFCKLGLVFLATYSINFTDKMVYCALLFTFLMTNLNGIAKLHGSKKTIGTIIVCTTITLALLGHKPYSIGVGKPIHGLIMASLSAISVASYIGSKLFLKLEAKYGFPLSNCISLFLSSLVDHLIMALFFIRICPMHRVWSMFYKETAYTTLFALSIYLCCLAVLYAKSIYLKFRKCIRLSAGTRLCWPFLSNKIRGHPQS